MSTAQSYDLEMMASDGMMQRLPGPSRIACYLPSRPALHRLILCTKHIEERETEMFSMLQNKPHSPH